jgi:hypothetical protein
MCLNFRVIGPLPGQMRAGVRNCRRAYSPAILVEALTGLCMMECHCGLLPDAVLLVTGVVPASTCPKSGLF